ncbi:MAG TPA: class I SAM-dependent methyltransferase [Solirubrobacteraceae bacterium]|nr:class I SAM-dependent methyltransferase [Solirubrobacteraceae bacterium]
MSDLERLLAEQARHYREHAGEYEDGWFRRGRYDHGPEMNARWRSNLAEAHAALDAFGATGDVLELACGTGLWTERLAAHTTSVTAIDASPEMLELCRTRAGAPHVDCVQADVFAWEPERTYDLCFFGFWLSHVPQERFEAFWAKVARAVGPRGHVFFIDNLPHEFAAPSDTKLPEPGNPVMLRRLADGREYRIVKRFYEPDQLQRMLGELGWNSQIHTTREFFIYGRATPAAR